jgi:hypothetical protein
MGASSCLFYESYGRGRSGLGHSLHFGSILMPGLPRTTTEWRRFENGQNVPRGDFTHEVDPLQGSRSATALADLACGAIPLPR